MKSKHAQLCFCFLGSLVAPLVICSAYIRLTRPAGPKGSDGDPISDWAVVLTSIGMGVGCLLALLPCPWLHRLLVAAAYVPGFGYILFMYWICFECARAGVWP